MTLANYIDGTYASIKTQLGWDSADMAMIESKTLQIYGVSLEAEATDTAKLETLADYAVWKQALADISLDYSFSADNASYHREQAVEQIRKNMIDAEMKAMPYMADYQITIHPDATYAQGWEEVDS